MALSLLGGLYAAAFHPAAIAANKVSVTVNPTTHYYEPTKSTFRVPPSAAINPIKDVAIPTVQKLPNGALAQQISSGIEITALKGGKLRGPIYGRITAGVSSLRSAAAGCFKSGRCNVALMAGALGLQALLDSVDWVMNEGGQPVKTSNPPATEVTPCTTSSVCYTSSEANRPPTSNIMATCVYYIQKGLTVIGAEDRGTTPHCHYHADIPHLTYWDQNRSGYRRTQNGIAPTITSPVSVSDIESAVQSNYTPEPSDFPFLIPEIDLGADDVNAEITDAPRLQAPPVTTTIYDANGVPVEVQETNTWVDFAPKDNPSKQPAVDAVETEKTDTYNKNGEQTGAKTETKPQAAPPDGAIVIPPAPLDIPTDCAFMPTLCEWLDWFKKDEPPEEPNFDDAKQVIDLRDYQENVTIGPKIQQCPEPMEFTVPYVNAIVSVSWLPFCDLADLVRPLLLLLAYFGGAVLTIRSI